MKPKISVLTTFYKWDVAYSLTSVVADQLSALVKHGYNPVLYVLKSFQDDSFVPEGVEVRKVVPQVILEPYRGYSVPPTMSLDVLEVKQALEEHMQDIDVCITHDIIFIDSYLPYNLAIRQSEKLKKIKFLHWIHSAPSSRLTDESNPHIWRFKILPNEKLVYLNNDKSLQLAEMYGAWPKDVAVVPNSVDPRTFWNLHPLVKYIINEYEILNADIVSVYPLSSTRMGVVENPDGKQLDAVILIHSKLKKLGKKTKLIVPNAHANGENEKKAISIMLRYAKLCGLDDGDVVFTSLEDPKWESGVPREVVSDLFRLSNVFIFPTTSENDSLVLQEAKLSKNLLVLNKDCSGLQEKCGGNALYFGFGSIDVNRTYTNREQFMEDVAKIIVSELHQNKPLQAFTAQKQTNNYDYIFTKFIEPLLTKYE